MIELPDSPALVARHGRAVLVDSDGTWQDLPAAAAAPILRARPPLLVHAPASFRRLGLLPGAAYDLLELFAFACPARPVAPSPRGLARALDLDPPASLEDEAALLPDIAALLLHRLAAQSGTPAGRSAAGIAARMGAAGWGWARFVLSALGRANIPPARDHNAYAVWHDLPEWQEGAPAVAPTSLSVPPEAARARLATLLGEDAEARPGQSDYAHVAAAAFAPRERVGDPTLVLAEAGTGTGKTLGYIAPASLWAELNGGVVWLSTYTRHLQRQIESELARLHPDPTIRRRKVVIRKGRENYLCLLNYEDAVAGAGNGPMAIPLGLIARWVLATEDGDLAGGDLPGWMGELFGHAATLGLADRRGECIHAACRHWRRCTIEHVIRRARTADLVVGNHALTMVQAAQAASWGDMPGEDPAAAPLPTRYVFDEGHQLFDAADSAFAAALSGLEAAELRRWLLGAEGGRSRARGVRRRIEDLLVNQPGLMALLDAACAAARALPAPGWTMRLAATVPELSFDPTLPFAADDDDAPEAGTSAPAAATSAAQGNPTEAFLAAARTQLLARDTRAAGDFAYGDTECDLFPPTDELVEAAARLHQALGRIASPLAQLAGRLMARLADAPEELDSATRLRIEAVCRGLRNRALATLTVWREMLETLAAPPPEPGTHPLHLLFLRLQRGPGSGGVGGSMGSPGGARDVGLHRHWLDPTVPFAATIAAPAHGLLITSATLRDGAGTDIEATWLAAEARVGAQHLPSPALRAQLASPFDYAAQTRTFIITDLAGNDIGALAGAYRALFLAAGGGGLGLFTAISRLRAVHARIAPAMDAANIPLYAQHVDALDNASLVELFRSEEESCLLGTDAMRDGVDVPGRALRLVVFERVPWPRPDLLHRSRRTHLSAGNPLAYDDRIARLRLRQAFGRLIRGRGDRGVFVLLDRRTPSRLLTAFPPGVQPARVGLAEAISQTREFLGDGAGE